MGIKYTNSTDWKYEYGTTFSPYYINRLDLYYETNDIDEYCIKSIQEGELPHWRALIVKDEETDAVINIRYASSAVMQGAAEVIVYGTAVKFVNE